jgi:hypothetical protein
MSVVLPRLFLITSTLALSTFAITAGAQVNLHLTTTQQTNCDATTDAAGLSLVPGSADLQATGVTLTGAGCGGGSADFAASVSAPGAATVGIPINVTWSASDDASICTYGTPASGASGWPSGASACTGAACAGSHSVPVTITTPGTYNFGITCTNATGFAQSGAVVAGGSSSPPSPNNFVLTAPAIGTTGSSFQVSWAVTGATSCSGSASVNGSSVNLPGWTDVTSPTSPRTATASVAGLYTIAMTCSNSFGSVTSLPATIAIQQGDTSCPAGRQTVGNLFYPPSQTLRNNVDLTLWDNIWGHNTTTDPVVPWPGFPGSNPVIKNFDKTQYVAAKLHVAANLGYQGFYKNISYNGGPNLTMSISESCGDFTPSQSACLREDIPSGDQGMVYWRQAAGTNFYCHLEANTDYYLNIKITDPAATGPNCTPSGTCYVHVQNNFGN